MGFHIFTHSTVGAGFLLSLMAYLYGSAENAALAEAAEPFLWVFGIVWGAFVLLTLVRNVKSL